MQSQGDAISASSLNESQRQEVLAQLHLILASSLFRQSKRYPAFLRYVVESTLEGGDEQLKERTIGMEVFGRQPHYDTSLDPTVRLTAAEVRKRLAQYYQQPEHAFQLHIDLQPGSYVPTFLWPAGTATSEEALRVQAPEEVASPQVEVIPEVVVLSAPQEKKRFSLRSVAWGAAATAALIFLVFFAYNRPKTPHAEDVWAPLLSDPNPISLVLPDLSKTEILPRPQETASTSVLSHIRDNRLVDFNDSVALARLAGMLGQWNKPYTVLLSSDTTFEDLQRGPDILIGAVDNPWTMRFLLTLPYSVARRGDSLTFEVTSKKLGTQHDWSIDLNQPFAKIQQDFGIVARLMDTITGRPVVIVAGLGQNGTAAGIHLLSDSELERKVTAAAPKGWSGRNFEIVFRTQIIDDKFGPPVVVAQEYW